MRWCLWLKDASPAELRALPEVMKRVEAVQGIPREKHRRAHAQGGADANAVLLYLASRNEVSLPSRKFPPSGATTFRLAS